MPGASSVEGDLITVGRFPGSIVHGTVSRRVLEALMLRGMRCIGLKHLDGTCSLVLDGWVPRFPLGGT